MPPSPAMSRLLERLRSHPSDDNLTLEDHRRSFATMNEAFTVPDDVRVTPVDIDGVAGEWLEVGETQSTRALLYLHGGGYVIGSAATHRETVARLARALDAKALTVDYRLAPEHPCPAAVEDAVTAYSWLLASGPEQILVAGESAGGGLVASMLVTARQRGLPPPACAVVVSPWTDLSLGGDSYRVHQDDPLAGRAVLERFSDWYLAGRDPRDPLASPLFADLSGLPPFFVTASTTEPFRDDAQGLVRALRRAGGNAELQWVEGAAHAWPLFPHLPETLATQESIREFTDRILSRSGPEPGQVVT